MKSIQQINYNHLIYGFIRISTVISLALIPNKRSLVCGRYLELNFVVMSWLKEIVVRSCSFTDFSDKMYSLAYLKEPTVTRQIPKYKNLLLLTIFSQRIH